MFQVFVPPIFGSQNQIFSGKRQRKIQFNMLNDFYIFFRETNGTYSLNCQLKLFKNPFQWNISILVEYFILVGICEKLNKLNHILTIRLKCMWHEREF